MKHKGLTYLILILAIMLAPLMTKFQEESPSVPADGLELTFVDVGQGDSAFIRTKNGETWLIDGGEDDEYRTQLLPFLNHSDVEVIDNAVVTHYHSDHAGGIVQLLKAGKIKNLYLPNYMPDNRAKIELMKNAEVWGTFVLDISAGDILDTQDPDLKLSVLHPEKGGFSADNENSNSMVIRLDYFDTSALLTGDLEEDAEKILLNKYDLETDILKVGHHGSSTSTCNEFLTEADPTYGIISAGDGNSYGHPHHEVLSRLADNDVLTYRTDLDGDITFILTNDGIGLIKTETDYSNK